QRGVRGHHYGQGDGLELSGVGGGLRLDGDGRGGGNHRRSCEGSRVRQSSVANRRRGDAAGGGQVAALHTVHEPVDRQIGRPSDRGLELQGLGRARGERAGGTDGDGHAGTDRNRGSARVNIVLIADRSDENASGREGDCAVRRGGAGRGFDGGATARGGIGNGVRSGVQAAGGYRAAGGIPAGNSVHLPRDGGVCGARHRGDELRCALQGNCVAAG